MIATQRLTLRGWTPADLDDLAALNADPLVMRYFTATRSREESAVQLGRLRGWEDTRGVTFWRVARADDDRFLGIAGLKPLTVPWPAADDWEIGWSFMPHAWGHGYATEAAAAALAIGLARAPRVIAMTIQANAPSWRVMERLGMIRAPELDFDHPEVPEGHPQRPHIVYAATAP